MTAATPTTIIGIDPGYDRLGWAIGQLDTHKHWTSIDYGCIQTDAKQTIFERYREIQTELTALLEEFHPNTAGIEAVFFSNNQKTAMRVSEVRGLIISELLRNQVTVCEFTPNQIKQAVTGFGSADKTAVAKMVQSTLQLEHIAVVDDAMDALATLITCQSWLGKPPPQL